MVYFGWLFGTDFFALIAMVYSNIIYYYLILLLFYLDGCVFMWMLLNSYLCIASFLFGLCCLVAFVCFHCDDYGCCVRMSRHANDDA